VVTEPVIAMVRPMASLGLFLADMAAWSVGWPRRLDPFLKDDPDRLIQSAAPSSRNLCHG
jgi:hypothetical protein